MMKKALAVLLTGGMIAGSMIPAFSAAAEEQVTLKWALWDISSTVYYEPLIEAYEADHPNVKIEMVDLGSTDYSTVLGTQLSGSGSDFDVVTIKDVPGYVTLVNKGVLETLNDRIETDEIGRAHV